ncbi:MAG: GNAT family N-acetyltransferase [Candidatus Thorarchaeota archaeon]
MGKLVPYDNEVHRAQFLELNVEYLTWFVECMRDIHGIDMASTAEGTVQDYVEMVLDSYTSAKPPDGIIYVLEIDGKSEGMGALRRVRGEIGEIKRMYIRPRHRGKGLGRSMFRTLIERAKEYGYSTLRLETGDFMKAAQSIYRSEGFEETDMHPETEVPEPYHPHMVFMEKEL